MKKNIILSITVILSILLTVFIITCFASDSNKTDNDNLADAPSVSPSTQTSEQAEKITQSPKPTATSKKDLSIELYASYVNDHDTKEAEKKAPKQQTVEVNGEKITGSFDEVDYQIYDNTEYLKYKADTNGSMFSVYSKSGIIRDFSIPIKEWGAFGNLSKDECKKIALNFASQFLNVDEYEYTGGFNEKSYVFWFSRFFDGIETSDGFAISVSTNGTVESFSRAYVEALQNENLDEEALREELKYLHSQEVLDEIDKIAENYPGYTDHDVNEMIIVLEDGSFAMKYSINVESSETGGEIIPYLVCRK